MVAVFVVFILAFWLVRRIWQTARAVSVRLRLWRRLKRKCESRGFRLRIERNLFASFFRTSDRPDLVIETKDADYLISFVTCPRRGQFCYFFSPTHYIRYSKLYVVLPRGRLTESFRHSHRLKKAPILADSWRTPTKNCKKIPILLFNPAPAEISHLAESGTRVETDGNGSALYGWTVYSAQGFLEFLQYLEE